MFQSSRDSSPRSDPQPSVASNRAPILVVSIEVGASSAGRVFGLDAGVALGAVAGDSSCLAAASSAF